MFKWNTLKSFSIFAACSFLYGCGGGANLAEVAPSDPPASTQPPATPPPPAPPPPASPPPPPPPPTPPVTGSVTLSWTAPTLNNDGSPLTDLAGYKFFWGDAPNVYTNSVTIDNPGITMYVVENLAPGEHYFVARSFNTSGIDSVVSNMVTKTVPGT